jgi:hypothetical protein
LEALEEIVEVGLLDSASSVLDPEAEVYDRFVVFKRGTVNVADGYKLDPCAALGTLMIGRQGDEDAPLCFILRNFFQELR